MLKAICLIFLLVQSGLVAAQTSDNEMEEFVRELETMNFAGWLGITFLCQYDESDSVLAEMCLKGTALFKFLATTAEIDYNVVDPNDFYTSSFRSGMHGHVVLEYYLVATVSNNRNANKAIYGRLAFTENYNNAIDKDAKDSTIRSLPRRGGLELWSRSAIGSGQHDQLGDAISDDFATHFKEAITHFLEYGTSRK